MGRPIGRGFEPLLSWQKDWLCENTESYRPSILRIEPLNGILEGLKIWMAVLQIKRRPCKIDRQECRTGKYAISGDAVDRCLESKDEQFTWRQRIEAHAPAWLPVVDLIERLMLREEVEPRQVGIGDEEPNQARPNAPFTWMDRDRIGSLGKPPETPKTPRSPNRAVSGVSGGTYRRCRRSTASVSWRTWRRITQATPNTVGAAAT